LRKSLADCGRALKRCLYAGALLSLCGLGACGQDDPLSALEMGEQGRVVRILDGDTLALSTGLVVKLAGVEAPSFGRGDAPDALYAKEAARMLEDMALGRTVQLRYPGLTRDKYDRAIAHVSTADEMGGELWLNHDILRRGGARARFFADTAALGDLLLEAEAAARLERAGLWSKRAYQIDVPRQLPPDYAAFTLIKGSVASAGAPQRPWAICTLTLDSGKVTLDIEPASQSHCALPSGAVIIARGYLKEGRMGIAHPLNISVQPAE